MEKKKVKKIVKIAALLFIVLLGVVLISIFAFLRSFDLNKYKPEIVSFLSYQLKKKVAIGDVRYSFDLKQGVAIHINNVKILDEKIKGSPAVFSVQEVQVKLNPEKFILNRELAVKNIVILSPRIVIYQNNSGQNSLQNFVFDSKSSERKEDDAYRSMFAASQTPSIPIKSPSVSVDSVRIKDGSLSFINESDPDRDKIEIKKIDFSINNFTLTALFPFDAQFAFLNDKQNIQISGNMQLDVLRKWLIFEGVHLKTDLSKISKDFIFFVYPKLNEVVRDEQIQGIVAVALNNLILDQSGILSINWEASIAEGKISVNPITAPLSDVSIRGHLQGDVFELDELYAKVSEGYLLVKGRVSGVFGVRQYEFDVTGDKIPFRQNLDDLRKGVVWEGAANVNIIGKASGLSGESLRKTLDISGKVSADQSELKEINVLREVLQKISWVPRLYDKLMDHLPEKYKQQLEEKNTRFQKAEVNIKSVNGKIIIDWFDAVADIFSLEGKAWLDVSDEIYFESLLFIPKDLSYAMEETIDEFSAFVGRDGRIKIPLKPYRGQRGSLKILPDFEYMGRRLLMFRGQQELQKVIEKKFPTGENSSVGTEQEPSSQENKEEKTPERKIIEGIFDSIFKEN